MKFDAEFAWKVIRVAGLANPKRAESIRAEHEPDRGSRIT
jgi:hypothetical protein